MGSVDISTYRIAIGLFHINRYYGLPTKNKYKKLSSSFDIFLRCFCQFPHILGYIAVTLINIFFVFVQELHKIEKILVFVLLIGKYKMDLQKTVLISSLFFLIVLLLSFLDSNYSHLIKSKNNYTILFMITLHLITFMPLINDKYSYRSHRWLFICGDISLNPGPKTENFRFCQWNLNSLTAHSYSRIPLLQAYMTQHDLHIAAISESALSKKIPDSDIQIPGYNSIRFDLENTDTHGGVIIYHKNNMAVINRTDLPTPQYTLILEITMNRKKLLFIHSY